MKPYVVAGIFARGGSKGVPRKNVRMIAGKPLIAHAIDAARQSAGIDRVFVSTDDQELRSRRRVWRGGALMRPAELAQDTSPVGAWQHAIRTLQGRHWDASSACPRPRPRG
jgi:N-acylneuraminate cytidylyltransferase